LPCCGEFIEKGEFILAARNLIYVLQVHTRGVAQICIKGDRTKKQAAGKAEKARDFAASQKNGYKFIYSTTSTVGAVGK